MAVGAPVVLTFTAGAPQWNVDFNGSWGRRAIGRAEFPMVRRQWRISLGKSQRREPWNLDTNQQVLTLNF